MGSLLGRPTAFERGDRIYLTTPLTLVTPTDSQIDEYAFASAVKTKAPNEHIGWLDGRYVEAGKPNLNNAMWLNDELALKSLTPMLMPITVMHDPRTAVGTIADCKLIDGSPSRIDTILAVWRHRFPEIWDEAEHNIKDGTLAQSMECFSPSYSCSECGQQYIKLHEGKEQGSWCEHLRNNSSSRILGDVCFTGTGLIFGTRGGQPAYTEANLGHFQDEIAEYHARAHLDSAYRPEGSPPKMGFIQIDETELANLRREKDDAKRLADERATAERELTTKVEKAEAEVTKEKTAKEEAEKKAKDLEDKAEQSTLKDKRLAALGTEFLAKLGEFTRGRLVESAGTLSDDDWESALKEKEEMAGVKRDAGGATPAKPTPADPAKPTPDVAAAGSAFSDEELAAFVARGGVAEQTPEPTNGVPATRQLARAFANKRKPTPTPVAK